MNSGTEWVLPEPDSVCEVVTTTAASRSCGGTGTRTASGCCSATATGSQSICTIRFWSRLADEFDLLVYDLRNHGWNAVGGTPGAQHAQSADQEQVIAEVARRYGGRPTVGVFHSLSALTALLSSALGVGGSGNVSAWVLFDPPLYRPGPTDPDFDAVAEKMAG